MKDYTHIYEEKHIRMGYLFVPKGIWFWNDSL